ncbi:MAG: hypothetical protein KC441_20710 [Anaerolineales bacterium]|nr:hypothetical protein [Anaerolineales bacterium]
MEEQFQTRVMAVQESGTFIIQDFFTSNHLLALVQFGESNAETLQDDPVVAVSWTGLVGRSGGEVDLLTEMYIGDMLADSVHVAS